jgi:hypothetical protein
MHSLVSCVSFSACVCLRACVLAVLFDFFSLQDGPDVMSALRVAWRLIYTCGSALCVLLYPASLVFAVQGYVSSRPHREGSCKDCTDSRPLSSAQQLAWRVAHSIDPAWLRFAPFVSFLSSWHCFVLPHNLDVRVHLVPRQAEPAPEHTHSQFSLAQQSKRCSRRECAVGIALSLAASLRVLLALRAQAPTAARRMQARRHCTPLQANPYKLQPN